MDKKICTSCKKSKPLSEYSNDRKRPDGSIMLKSICKRCNSVKAKERSSQKIVKDPLKSMTASPVGKDAVFTVEQVEGLMQLLTIKEKLLVMASTPNTLSAPTDKGDLQGVTLSKTFKVYQSVLDKFNHYIATREGEKIQDIVSMALIEYIDNH